MESLTKTLLGTTLTVGVLAGLAAGLTYVTDNRSRRQQTIQKAYALAAGEDRILSKNEELKLYKDLFVERVLKESETYTLKENPFSSGYHLSSLASDNDEDIPAIRIDDYIKKKELEGFER